MSVDNPAILAGGEFYATSPPLAQRLLNIVLFITVLLSSIAFIEPSPHDLSMAVLLVICVGARVRFDRKILPLVMLLTLWLVGAFFALIPVVDQKQTVQYVGTSVYLALAAVIFACLFCDGNSVRLLILRRAYVIAALIATAAGYVGFFHMLPGSDIFLTNDRVSATFKDPNVYAPFLIFPLLLLLVGMMTERVRLSGLLVTIVLVGGLLLSFSRGAWAHFAISAAVAVILLIVTAPDPRVRGRIMLFTFGTLVVIALLFSALMSVSSVHDLFIERAKAIQPYDVGPGGRFWEQKLALSVILDHPNGMGPFEFGRIYGTQQHDVYMQGFLVYGWLGGAAYLTMVLVTLAVGLRAAVTWTPWQSYLIAAYACFVGEACEGLIVDTDHWRHFFLLLGMIWGLTTATINFRRSETWNPALARDRGDAASSVNERSGRPHLSDQSAAQYERGKPHQPGKPDAAEHGGGPVILDPSDIHVLLGGHVVGKLFDRGVEELDRQQSEQRADHSDIPGQARRNEQTQKQPRHQQDHFLAQRGLAAKAVAYCPQRIDGRAEKPFHGRSDYAGSDEDEEYALYVVART